MTDLNKPVCFGSVLSYNARSDFCNTCLEYAGCGVARNERAIFIRNSISRGYKEPVSVIDREEVSIDHVKEKECLEVIKTEPLNVSPRVQKELDTLVSKEIDIMAIKRGENPFINTNRQWLRCIVDRLLASPCRYNDLSIIIQANIGVNSKTAKNYASLARSVLYGTNIISDKCGLLEIKYDS